MNFEKKSGLFRSGAGVIAALVVIVLFILTAMYLKSLIFGIIAAYFFLPLRSFSNGECSGPRRRKSWTGFFTSSSRR